MQSCQPCGYEKMGDLYGPKLLQACNEEINFLAPYVGSEGMLSFLPKNKNILKMKYLKVAV